MCQSPKLFLDIILSQRGQICQIDGHLGMLQRAVESSGSLTEASGAVDEQFRDVERVKHLESRIDESHGRDVQTVVFFFVVVVVVDVVVGA